MSEFVMVKRELLELALLELEDRWSWTDELRAALAQEAGHVEEPFGVVPEGWKLVPVEPTAEMLRPIRRSKYPEDWEAGKRLQRLRGSDVVCFNTETECAVGQYERMLAAAPDYFDKVKELNR